MNQLDQLKKMSKVVADTGDICSIKKYFPEDVTTNPSLILNAISLKRYSHLLNESIIFAKKKNGNRELKIQNASDYISVLIGKKMLSLVPGYVSTEIDSRLSFDTEKSIENALRIINLYEEKGVSRNRILIKIAATWSGILAAKELKKYNVNCNLTLVFSFAQARSCAEAEVFLISPFVGRICDWYQEKFKNDEKFSNFDDFGVGSVKKIYNYYKKFSYKTIIMAASFRNTNQILELAGCDRLTISPIFLEELKTHKKKVHRKLFLRKKNDIVILKNTNYLSKEEFHWEHNQDEMAVCKLSEGIRNFGYDQVKLEKIISKEL